MRFKTTIVDLVGPTSNPGMNFYVGQTPNLPSDLVHRVSDYWTQFTAEKIAKGESVNNGRILYVKDWQRTGSRVDGNLFVDNFSNSVYLSRSKVGEADFDRVMSGEVPYGISFTTWGVPITLDQKLVFAHKKGAEYASRSVSSFGGISKEIDLTDGKLDLKKLTDRTLGKEIGAGLWDERTATSYNGMCVAQRSATRDQHTVWSFNLNAESGKVQERFSRDPQFGKDLIFVDNTSEGLIGFMTNPNWDPTCVCIGGVCTYILSTFGEQGKEWLAQYQKNPRSAVVEVKI